MARTYAIADLHGRHDLFKAALSRIDEHAGEDGGTVVFMGDYVDRGPESAQILADLRSGPRDGKRWRWQILRGNHEDMMEQVCRTKLNVSWWIGNGGGSTLISFGHPPSGKADVSFVPVDVLDWIVGLPRMHVDAHRVFVHAGIDPTIPLDEQSEHTLAWYLYPDGADIGHGERHVVHGHHQFEDGPICLKNRTDLDTLAWATGRLVIGVFDDDKPGGPVEFLEIKGPCDPRWN